MKCLGVFVGSMFTVISICVLVILSTSLLGCTMAGTATDRAVGMMDNWSGTIILEDGSRIEVGGGIRTEYYGYVQLDGINAALEATGDNPAEQTEIVEDEEQLNAVKPDNPVTPIGPEARLCIDQ